MKHVAHYIEQAGTPALIRDKTHADIYAASMHGTVEPLVLEREALDAIAAAVKAVYAGQPVAQTQGIRPVADVVAHPDHRTQFVPVIKVREGHGMKHGDFLYSDRDVTRLLLSQPSGPACLADIRAAVAQYHADLDARKHGGVAMDKAMHAIESALGMPWVQGASLIGDDNPEGRA